MKKNRVVTEEKIYKAFVSLLQEKGPQGVGINAIAKKASVSKELIYRYFGGMKGLLYTYAEKGDFFKSIAYLEGNENISIDQLRPFILEGTKEVRNNKLTQEILRWQLIENNDLTKDLFKYTNSKIGKVFSVEHENKALQPAFQLMIGGYIYFTLLSKFNKTFITTDLSKEETWNDFDNAIESSLKLFEGRSDKS
ncbi:MAG: TetR/AcrR family transcriptional regulator [Flavobacteriaceae bacterium]|nr:TetR/AcrR family transcriptional regulator [Flavobacteriaceae bacterium]